MCSIIFQTIKYLTIAQASPLRGWTVFKSQFCGFAAQKYSTKPQLKNSRLARRYSFAFSSLPLS